MGDSSSDQLKSLGYFISKIGKGDAARWEKDELLDVIYWFRQVIGVIFGVLWGVGQTTGLWGFLMFIILNCMLTVAAYKSILGIDEDEYGGHTELVAEGMPSCLASFLVTWVLTYTALHT